jgi:hypothetical protein
VSRICPASERETLRNIGLSPLMEAECSHEWLRPSERGIDADDVSVTGELHEPRDSRASSAPPLAREAGRRLLSRNPMAVPMGRLVKTPAKLPQGRDCVVIELNRKPLDLRTWNIWG